MFSLSIRSSKTPQRRRRRRRRRREDPVYNFGLYSPTFCFAIAKKIHRHSPLVYCTDRRTQIPQRCDQYTSRFCTAKTAKTRSSSDAPPVAWATLLSQKEDDDDPYLQRTHTNTYFDGGMQYVRSLLSCDGKYWGYLHSKNRILVKRKEKKRKEKK
jgi:hypothetical protein